MTEKQLEAYMEEHGFSKVDLFATMDPPALSLGERVSKTLHALGRKMYGSLLPPNMPNILPPPSVTELTEAEADALRKERVQLYRIARSLRDDARVLGSKLLPFWEGLFRPVQPQAAKNVPAAESVPLPSPVPSDIDTLAERFFNTPEYAFSSDEHLIVQLPEDGYADALRFFEERATVVPLAPQHRVYRLTDIALTAEEAVVLQTHTRFSLRVDADTSTTYDVKKGLVYFDSSKLGKLGRVLTGSIKLTANDYAVQPRNGSTQAVLDAVQQYEAPPRVIDLQHGLFVFAGRDRLLARLLNSDEHKTVVPTPAYGAAGVRVYHPANTHQLTKHLSQN